LRENLLNDFIGIFVKKYIGVKKATADAFVYGELGRMPLQTYRCYDIVKYWLKLLLASEHKYTKKVYTLLKSDLDARPNVKKNGVLC